MEDNSEETYSLLPLSLPFLSLEKVDFPALPLLSFNKLIQSSNTDVSTRSFISCQFSIIFLMISLILLFSNRDNTILNHLESKPYPQFHTLYHTRPELLLFQDHLADVRKCLSRLRKMMVALLIVNQPKKKNSEKFFITFFGLPLNFKKEPHHPLVFFLSLTVSIGVPFLTSF